jgi:hypothetical protein
MGLQSDTGALLYRLLEQGTQHWTYIERAELQSTLTEIASEKGITANGVLPELVRIERAIKTSDTALFEELDSLRETDEQPAAYTGFQLLMHALQRSLDHPGILSSFDAERVNRILVAMDDQLKALDQSEYEVEPLYQALYQLLEKLTGEWPAQDRQRLQAMAESAFAS